MGPLNNFDGVDSAYAESFQTQKLPFVTLDSGVLDNSSITAIITTGDNLTSGFKFPQTPDGIGVIQLQNGTVDLFINHELENDTEEGQDGFAKVSKLSLNQSDLSIINGTLVINGTEEYEALCSSYLVDGQGFIHPVYFTNEETDDGLVISIDVVNNTIKELPWLGKFSHENTIPIPYFADTINKTVMLGFEDGEPTESEVYMYMADSPSDLLNDNGQLFVFGLDNNNRSTSTSNTTGSSWDGIYFNNKTTNGKFIPLEWDHKTQNETVLHTEAIEKGGFQFIRPEDGAMDKRQGYENIAYMIETGSDLDENDEPIPASLINGQNFTDGRIYKFAFTDPSDPTKVAIEVMADGNDPNAPGYGVLVNPDNIDTSRNSIMVQEDHNDYNRFTASSPYNVTNNAKIIQIDLETNEFKPVAYVNQHEDESADHGEWESSGIIDASKYFGEGTWILDVQAHSINEGGQVLFMNIPNS